MTLSLSVTRPRIKECVLTVLGLHGRQSQRPLLRSHLDRNSNVLHQDQTLHYPAMAILQKENITPQHQIRTTLYYFLSIIIALLLRKGTSTDSD